MLTPVVKGHGWVGLLLIIGVLMAGVTGCVTNHPTPPTAVMRTTPPPWDAPREAIANIHAAHLLAEPMDTTTNQRITSIEVIIDGQPIEVPAHVGIDRLRALQAAAHTHDPSGEIWLEGTEAPTVTLGQFFTLWGVRFDATCLAAACGTVEVTADGAPVKEPEDLVLASTRSIRVEVRSAH